MAADEYSKERAYFQDIQTKVELARTIDDLEAIIRDYILVPVSIMPYIKENKPAVIEMLKAVQMKIGNKMLRKSNETRRNLEFLDSYRVDITGKLRSLCGKMFYQEYIERRSRELGYKTLRDYLYYLQTH